MHTLFKEETLGCLLTSSFVACSLLRLIAARGGREALRCICRYPPPLYREGILLLLLPDRPLSSLLLCLLLFLLHFPLHLLLLLLLLLLPAGSNSPGPS